MITTKYLGLTVLAMTLTFGVPAFAQNAGASPPPPTAGAEHRGFEHPEFREEREKLRAEREELKAAHEKLMDRCMNAPKDQAASCQQERKELHERAERLHEREKAFHEKMEAMHKEHMEHHQPPAGPAPTAP